MSDTNVPGMLSGEFNGTCHPAAAVPDHQSSARPPLEFDASRYLAEVEDLSLSEAQKVEFLKALWSIMTGFVDLGFAVDSAIPLLIQKASESGTNALQQTIPKHEFNVAVDDGVLEP